MIRKEDGHIEQANHLLFDDAACMEVTTSNSYLISISEQGQAKIFQDTKEGFSLLSTLDSVFNGLLGRYVKYYSVSLHQNWLLVGRDGTLFIRNILTGKKLYTALYSYEETEFCMNFTQLFMRRVVNTPKEPSYSYTLYDFRPFSLSNKQN